MTRVLVGVLAAAMACGGQSSGGSHDIAPVAVSILPASATIGVGESMTFTASVTGAADKTVTWSVRESDGGVVDQTGHYLAPSTAGVFHVVAASNADSSKTAAAEVTVSASLPPITISIDPHTASVAAQGTVQFTAIVGGAADSAFTFSAPDGGSVTQGGLFTAPDVAGTFRVIATAHADSSKTATATVQVSVTPPQVSISLSPASFSIQSGASQQLTASVGGTNDTGVAWSVEENGGGAVDSNGRYTAPQTQGTFHVVATSHADPTKSAVAAAQVTAAPPQPTIVISPKTTTVAPGTAIQFQAAVTGLSDTRVAYSADGGSIDATSGAYTAPFAAGNFQVTATSVADPSLTATAIVTVVSPPAIVVTVTPASAQTIPGGSVRFSATVTGSTDTSVIWSVQEGSSGGSIDQSGQYISPSKATGTWHVVATSHADSTKQAVATITSYDDLIDRSGPVIPQVNVYELWWGPTSNFPPDERSGVESFFEALNRSHYLSILNQYLRGQMASVALAKRMVDETTPSASVTVDQELCSQLAANGMAVDPKGIYFVYRSDPPPPTACAGHTFIQCQGEAVVMAQVWNLAGSACDAAAGLRCNSLTTGTQAVVDNTAHELAESMTDPFQSAAWQDTAGEEIADKCAWQFSSCVQLGAQNWQLPELYSNAAHSCVQGE